MTEAAAPEWLATIALPSDRHGFIEIDATLRAQGGCKDKETLSPSATSRPFCQEICQNQACMRFANGLFCPKISTALLQAKGSGTIRPGGQCCTFYRWENVMRSGRETVVSRRAVGCGCLRIGWTDAG